MNDEAIKVIKEALSKLRAIYKKEQLKKLPNKKDIESTRRVIIDLNVALIADEESKK